MDIAPLPAAAWHAARDRHAQRADQRTAAHRARRQRGEAHPVEDFLFTYYPFSPGKLARWHPGAGVRVRLGDGPDRAEFARRWYALDEEQQTAAVDLEQWRAQRGDGARFIAGLLTATLHREATFGCFGLHEWAMVYRQSDDDRRHGQVPLRLSRAQTDAVVEGHRVQCSHFDAFRFFTEPARPLNTLQPTRTGMVANEQPGCLHAGMDLYKWAMKLEPIVASETVLDAFDLAVDIRRLDMEASPYDLHDWGLEPVRIETAAGKAEYKRRQEALSVRAQEIRRRLLAALAAAGVQAAAPQPARA
ncbi:MULTISPECIES: 3-methyladenine DNA glycosylase [Brevibacterium]|uniref:3-methyladenine DNA glycosylase n=1 Tax=Brevibacterium TaxID=1696 RepID=UPI00192709D7|nr:MULTISPECIES: 3-methyladenine DNA glycosylase [Brevibacterium]WAL41358.1 3-methyladenine DNA glycosylase [Brevibacterium sp. BRM-1]